MVMVLMTSRSAYLVLILQTILTLLLVYNQETNKNNAIAHPVEEL